MYSLVFKVSLVEEGCAVGSAVGIGATRVHRRVSHLAMHKDYRFASLDPSFFALLAELVDVIANTRIV